MRILPRPTRVGPARRSDVSRKGAGGYVRGATWPRAVLVVQCGRDRVALRPAWARLAPAGLVRLVYLRLRQVAASSGNPSYGGEYCVIRQFANIATHPHRLSPKI